MTYKFVSSRIILLLSSVSILSQKHTLYHYISVREQIRKMNINEFTGHIFSQLTFQFSQYSEWASPWTFSLLKEPTRASSIYNLSSKYAHSVLSVGHLSSGMWESYWQLLLWTPHQCSLTPIGRSQKPSLDSCKKDVTFWYWKFCHFWCESSPLRPNLR